MQIAEEEAAKRSLPQPYNRVKLLPFAPEGWYYNARHLEALIKNNSIRVIIEVGCWLGQSTMHMAWCLPKEGKLYAIDHWQGSAEHQPGQPSWLPELSMAYEYFLSNVIHARLTDKIIPVKMASLEAAVTLPVMADLIYIDASHDFQSVYSDLVAWHAHLLPCGILCGDDWLCPDVKAAVQLFAKERNVKIGAVENFWRLFG